MRVPALCALFATLLIVTIYYSREPASMSSSQGMVGFGAGTGTGPGTGARGLSAEIAADDPVAQFTQTRIGQLLFASQASDNCRRILFDNRSGSSFETSRVYCGQVASTVAQTSGADRIEALRKSFQKEQAATGR